MTRKLYIRPIALADSPQSEEGGAVRLGGAMVWASRFALILREGGKVIARERVSASQMPAALAALPADLGAMAEAQWANLRKVHAPIQCGARTIRFEQPQVMGILNMTPDSFSDGGRFLDNLEVAAAHASAMLEAGAAIVDLGGESTRPGAAAVWEGDELKRVVPMVERLAAMGAAISVDTRRPAVMEATLTAGAHIINDVSALRYDPRSLQLAAESGAPVVLMHAPGKAEDLHSGADFDDVVLDVFDWLEARRDACVAAGIPADRIIIDPGFGFGLTLGQNLTLFNALPLFHALGQPLLVGVSRKRMIGALSNEAPAHQRLGGSVALAVKAMDAGAHILRVHDVPETVQAARVWRGLRDAALTDFSQLPQ
ncbi:dihydropteroate synthase [Novosphingobium resinovorum]|uniref:dihydropteroate synthase n=1 Tax=Novosphingobium resinovorum TaxID=158500 RepID=A0A1D8A1U0_9SPHN|nr:MULTISPECIES: dihydropteroate synthase [Sphingomonadaceae]AOR76093.1 dihydropteroate synthase [Novosphingobium resinovorum]EJU13165.1 dihydropteroate synthase [Sphingomonas sp. LH128]MBF7011486.1 dihydropteroate synthase [Novosphingobium sp. HR1a]WJM29461.1 dihydropteroate synthase [Novosphingobium resinovorum]